MKIEEYNKKRDRKKVEILIKDTLEEIFKKRDNKFKIKNNEKTFFLLAKEKEKIIGTIALKRLYKFKGRLKWMYINKKHRRKGIANELYNKVLNYCEKNNLNQISLTTYPQMKEAQKFYAKKGFKMTNKKYKDKRRQFILNLK